MTSPLEATATGTTKRIESDHYVEGFATTFDSPYVLYEYDGIKVMEVIDRNAIANADLSDVIMQYDHYGTVYARNKMAKGKPPSLLVEPQDSGLFIAADLGIIEEARNLYTSIDKGLIYKMSWAFTVEEDAYNKETRTRTILKIKKVYDVSAVSYPANAGTDISARALDGVIGGKFIDGVIEEERRGALERRAQLLRIKLMTEV